MDDGVCNYMQEYELMCVSMQNCARKCSLCFEVLDKGFRVVGLGYCLTLKFVIMAKQKGIVKLKGTIGDYTFYKTKDGYLAREKGGIEKSRIMNEPAFKRTPGERDGIWNLLVRRPV